MSFSLHSSTENFGWGRRSTSPGSNSNSRLSWPGKSSIGLMSENASASPRSRNQRNESRWTETRSGGARTSSRLAKENRSGLLELEYNDLFLPDVKVGRDRFSYYGDSNIRTDQPCNSAAETIGHRVGHGPAQRPEENHAGARVIQRSEKEVKRSRGTATSQYKRPRGQRQPPGAGQSRTARLRGDGRGADSSRIGPPCRHFC